MWKQYFDLFNAVVNVGLIALAFWVGIVQKDYSHASFLLLLVILNKVI